MKIEQLYKIFLEHPVITTDSRNVPSHSIFFALTGDKFDGNDYLLQTLDAGADYAVGARRALPSPQKSPTSPQSPNLSNDERIIWVDDVLQTLQDLANYHRQQMPATVIGITGTNGKTTTKELIATALSAQYKILYTQGNLNNHIGVPLTLLQIQPEHEFAVIEMGANHPGEIQALCRIAEPDFGLITNVGKAHLEGFGSFEGVIKTKTELYEFLSNTDGTAFANLDNLLLKDLYTTLNRVYYGTTSEAFVHGHITASAPTLALEWSAPHPLPCHCGLDPQSHQQLQGMADQVRHDRKGDVARRSVDATPNGGTITTNLVGSYNFENVLAAICVASYFNVSAEKINHAIAEYIPTNNRSQQLKTAHNDLIVDAYNANPSSMQVALDNFNLLNVSPKMVILGEMRELGKYSAEEHQKIVAQLQKFNIEKIFLIGENFILPPADTVIPSQAKIPSDWQVFSTTDELIAALQRHPIAHYHILIKGSRGNQLEKVIPFI